MSLKYFTKLILGGSSPRLGLRCPVVAHQGCPKNELLRVMMYIYIPFCPNNICTKMSLYSFSYTFQTTIIDTKEKQYVGCQIFIFF